MLYATARRVLSLLSAVILLVLVGGCELDFVNPNNPSEEQVLRTTEGIRTLTVGMQEFYATSTLEETIIVTGTTSRELAATNSQQNFVNLNDGGTSLPNTNADVEALLTANYRIVGMAEDLIDSAPDVGFEEGTEKGIVATARLFKALALGNVAGAFEQAPTASNRESEADFVPRQQVYEEAISLLNEARSDVTSVDAAQLSDFGADILALTPSKAGPRTLLLNTIDAYRARFNLYAGNNQAAIDAANQVPDPSVVPQFSYGGQSQNPVWFQLKNLSNFAARDSFGTKLTQSGDQRIDFYTSSVDETGLNDYPIDQIEGFWTSASSAVPLYVLGELPLIRAEAKLNQGAAASDVIAEIDAVRTKAPGEDPVGIGADLSAYSGGTSEAALREEILRQRRAELYLQGVALADSRRLGPDVSDRQNPGAFERNRNFYPYPAQERRNNPNTPEDPGF